MSDANGAKAYESQYKPFGQQYGEVGAQDPKLRFTGQWKDPTGYYYMFRRFYDPLVGQFLSQDRILGHVNNPQSLNRYSYVTNNPLSQVDPTGEDWWNPTTWGQDVQNVATAAADAVGNWWTTSSWEDKLDLAMTVIGFVPGLEVVSGAYFFGKALVKYVNDPSPGNLLDLALNAAFLLAPGIGEAFSSEERTAVNAVNEIEDSTRTIRSAGREAKAAEVLESSEPSVLRKGKETHKAWELVEADSEAARGHEVGKDVLFNRGIPKEGRGVGIGGGKRVRPDEVRLYSDTIIELKPFDDKATLIERYGNQFDSYRQAYRDARGVDPKLYIQTYFR